ncbi:MAG: rhodanese-like domain-containing protein [Sulfuricaulis sp.]
MGMGRLPDAGGHHPLPGRDSGARGGIARDAEIVVLCHHGIRSVQAVMYLERAGLTHLHNLVGGLDAWAREVDPIMPIY